MVRADVVPLSFRDVSADAMGPMEQLTEGPGDTFHPYFTQPLFPEETPCCNMDMSRDYSFTAPMRIPLAKCRCKKG